MLYAEHIIEGNYIKVSGTHKINEETFALTPIKAVSKTLIFSEITQNEGAFKKIFGEILPEKSRRLTLLLITHDYSERDEFIFEILNDFGTYINALFESEHLSRTTIMSKIYDRLKEALLAEYKMVLKKFNVKFLSITPEGLQCNNQHNFPILYYFVPEEDQKFIVGNTNTK